MQNDPIFDSSNPDYIAERQKFYEFLYNQGNIILYYKAHNIDILEIIKHPQFISYDKKKLVSGEISGKNIQENLVTVLKELYNKEDNEIVVDAKKISDLFFEYLSIEKATIEKADQALKEYKKKLSESGYNLVSHQQEALNISSRYIQERYGNNAQGIGVLAGNFAIYDTRKNQII